MNLREDQQPPEEMRHHKTALPRLDKAVLPVSVATLVTVGIAGLVWTAALMAGRLASVEVQQGIGQKCDQDAATRIQVLERAALLSDERWQRVKESLDRIQSWQERQSKP